MTKKDIAKKKLPSAPGVYFFLGARKKILYIGKASSLRDRVKSYFSRDIEKTRGPLISKMIVEARDIAYEKTDSVLEALILEVNLIKKHQPVYNTKEKSDKSFNYVVITAEDFPRVILVRGRELEHNNAAQDAKYVFGPFPHGTIFKEAMRIVRKLFPFRDRCIPPSFKAKGKPKRVRPCFNRQIGLCPGVCSGEISKSEYARTITHIKLFFEGKKKALIKKLEQEMKTYARKKEFEKAHAVKKTLFALNHIQDIALIKETLSHSIGPTYGSGFPRKTSTFSIQRSDLWGYRVEGYDVAHLSGSNMVGVMTVVEDGEINKSEYRKFNIKTVNGINDTAALREILSRRLVHNEWRLPNLVVVDGGVAQKNTALKVLKEAGMNIPVVSVVKDERHRPRSILGEKTIRREHESEILLVNSEAHRFAISFHRKRLRKR